MVVSWIKCGFNMVVTQKMQTSYRCFVDKIPFFCSFMPKNALFL
jgi:hypothetical protein